MAAINGQKDHQRNQLFLVDKSGKKTKMSQAEQVAVKQISISGFAKIESSIFEIFHIFNKFRLKTHLHDTIQFDKMILYIS